MKDHIIVVGADPSLNAWGNAKAKVSLVDFSVELIDLLLVETEKGSGKQVRKSSDDLRRSQELYRGFSGFCSDASLVIAEVPSGTQSARGAMSNGICLGVLSASPLPIIQVAPLETKLATVGTKTASKAEMIEWATGKYPEAPWLRTRGRLVAKNEHLADATAIVYAGVLTDQFKQLASILRQIKG